ncbi:MAG TPA: type II toxin-antitoxin system RelE/ParE family toxin [Candidatus Saccharimonadales bacterium]|nr:type II toxin-antitoxin system RelE/ParE family toxin [Candidatus Saccharimonadales bacterium]
MPKTRIQYYVAKNGENPVKEFIDSLSKQQKAKIFRIFLTIEEYGLLTILPHTKKLSGTSLWEIRILGKDNIRILYVTVTNKHVLVLHGFIKKKQKTPQKEITIATIRYKDWLEE